MGTTILTAHLLSMVGGDSGKRKRERSRETKRDNNIAIIFVCR